MPTNHYVSCSHHETVTSLTQSSSPVPAAVEANTESAWMSLMGQCVVCAHFQSHQPRSLNSAGFQKEREGNKFPFQLSTTFYEPGSEAALLEFWDISHKKFGQLLTLT